MEETVSLQARTCSRVHVVIDVVSVITVGMAYQHRGMRASLLQAVCLQMATMTATVL